MDSDFSKRNKRKIFHKREHFFIFLLIFLVHFNTERSLLNFEVFNQKKFNYRSILWIYFLCLMNVKFVC